jgi:signal transduction histidine kinase
MRRRQQPVAVLALATVLAAGLGFFAGFWLVPGVVIAIGTVSGRVDRHRSIQLTLVAAAVLAVPSLLANDGNWANLLAPAFFFALAWLYGESKWTAERDREKDARQALVDERARIARELHDVLTHNVSVMVVQAAAGNDVFDTHPARARDALLAVEATGRRALGELRKLLDVTAGGEGTLPQPGLARVEELVDRVRGAGLAVDLTVEGTPREMPEALDLSAYRIVQEALTNTLKHARATHADVRIRYRHQAVEVEVSDDGVGPAGTSADGRGLIGMRERVGLFGGELRAGPGPAGGFAVSASMPLETA